MFRKNKKEKVKKPWTIARFIKIISPLLLIGIIVLSGYQAFSECGTFFNNYKRMQAELEKDFDIATMLTSNSITDQDEQNLKSKLGNFLIDKFTGIEKEPPSITTEEGLTSEECIDYFISKIVNMGLDIDAETFADVFARYDYDLSGDDSIISTSELYNVSYTSKFMNHDFEGNIKDTHALDYLANVYAAALKNK